MTEIVPISPAVPDAVPDSSAVDAALAARARADGEFIAGLILAAELDTVGSPRKLPQDLWPQSDPALQELVQEVFQRGVAVGFRAGRFFGAPRFYRDKLASLQGRLVEAGYAAMGRGVGPAVAAAYRAPEWHRADGEVEREH
jgi:hypothetical protein